MADNGWKRISLGSPEVSIIIMGQSPASSTYNKSGKGLPFFQGKIDFGLRHPTPSTWCSAPSRIAEPGDVLISVRAPVGDVNIATEKCCIGRGISAIRAGTKSDNEFLLYCLLHRKAELDALGTGATFKAINKDTLYSFEIQLPPLSEQRAIAAVLSKIQAATEVQEKIVATLKELKAATMAKLFREGLRGEALKQTEIGKIPESWETTPLGNITQVSTGTTPSTTDADYYVGDIPFVKTAEIDNNIISRSQNYISQRAVQDYNLRIVSSRIRLFGHVWTG